MQSGITEIQLGGENVKWHLFFFVIYYNIKYSISKMNVSIK